MRQNQKKVENQKLEKHYNEIKINLDLFLLKHYSNILLLKLMYFITLVIIFIKNLLINVYLLNLIIYYLNPVIYTRLITKSNV